MGVETMGVETIGVETAFHPARKAHPAFLVDNSDDLSDDLDDLARRLSEAGATVSSDEALPGYRRFYADDPFGHRLGLLTPHSLSPA